MDSKPTPFAYFLEVVGGKVGYGSLGPSAAPRGILLNKGAAGSPGSLGSNHRPGVVRFSQGRTLPKDGFGPVGLIPRVFVGLAEARIQASRLAFPRSGSVAPTQGIGLSMDV